MTSSYYKWTWKNGILAISRTITNDYSIRFSIWNPITCTQNGTSSPLLLKKPHKTINLRYYIFFSYLFMKSLEKSNPRTIGTELPNCQYWTPERPLIPTGEMSGYRIVGLQLKYVREFSCRTVVLLSLNWNAIVLYLRRNMINLNVQVSRKYFWKSIYPLPLI